VWPLSNNSMMASQASALAWFVKGLMTKPEARKRKAAKKR